MLSSELNKVVLITFNWGQKKVIKIEFDKVNDDRRFGFCHMFTVYTKRMRVLYK